MALVAYMLGARVLEKHFTLSHSLKGTDHAFSLMPEGMRKLVRDLRRAPARSATASSAVTRARSGRWRRWARSSSPRANCRRGMCSAADDVAIKSPAGGGLPPYEYDAVVGRRLARPMAADQGLTLLDLEPAEAPLAAEAS